MKAKSQTKGWKEKRMGDICIINPSKEELKKIDENLTVSFIPMAYVSEDGQITSMDKRPLKEVKKGFTFFKNGDVLLAKITPCFENGKRAIAESLTNDIGFGTTEFYVLRPKEEVISKWIFYTVSREDFRSGAKRSMGGAVGQQRVARDFLEKFEIPLPSLQEQILIVSEIEKQFTRLDAAVKSLTAVKKKLEIYKKAVLKKAFEKGERIKLGDILDFKNGINFSKNQKGRGILTIDVLNMYTKSIYVDFDRLYRVDIIPKEDYILKNGDILFVRSSVKREGIGFSTLFKKIGEQVTFCGFLIRGRIKNSNIIPEYLIYYLRSQEAREQIINNSSQVTITNISQPNLSRVNVPKPPSLPEQSLIVSSIESRFSVIDKVEQVIETSLEKAEKLRKSILKSAFEGKLVNFNEEKMEEELT